MLKSYSRRALIFKDKKNNERMFMRIHYEQYHFSAKEIVRYIVEGTMLVGLMGYFFYRSVFFTLLLSPTIFFFLKKKREFLCKKRKEELSIQFKDAINSVNSSLQAGYSMENAFSEAYRDMVEYHGVESIIAKELLGIKIGIRNNQVLEELIEDLGNRSGVEDIRELADILRIGKQSGGNLGTLFGNSIAVIEEKLTVKQEIQTLISSKRLESNIMCIIPFFIILYMDITSNGYFNALYTTVAGRILMTICLGVYIVGVHLSQKIMEIEV